MQIGNYVRGKFWEMLILWWATYVSFAILGINFAMLLAVLVGVSVVIPFIGAAVVTFPVALVAYIQWALHPTFAILMTVYFIIQALDGNVVVPLLFRKSSTYTGGHHRGRVGFWRLVGFLGCVFRYPTCDLGPGYLGCLAHRRERDRRH